MRKARTACGSQWDERMLNAEWAQAIHRGGWAEGMGPVYTPVVAAGCPRAQMTCDCAAELTVAEFGIIAACRWRTRGDAINIR
jgi:hypothetical protein